MQEEFPYVYGARLDPLPLAFRYARLVCCAGLLQVSSTPALRHALCALFYSTSSVAAELRRPLCALPSMQAAARLGRGVLQIKQALRRMFHAVAVAGPPAAMDSEDAVYASSFDGLRRPLEGPI